VSDIIKFLEKMGSDAQLRGASGVELEAALSRAGLESTLWTAILGMKQSELESLLDARSNVCSLVFTPDEEEEEEEEDEEEKEDDAEEQQDDKVKKPQSGLRRTA
jgi:DNA mismatch repair protein MutH